MRIHHLTVTAFGPFAGRVDVDLDALSSSGLFLIHGPTGAGKTSLLDALCFALFAGVPGARARAKKSLRSDHAPRDRRPEVTLEFTAGSQRLRLTRSPEYDRPKKRGTGEVSVPAKVSLEVRRGDEWEVLSTRADEVGDTVNDVVGMGLAQFSKVAILPQGEFAAFLRASAEDRRSVLEKLFDISAFADVESWLADERRRSAAEATALETALSSRLSRVRDVAAQGGWALLGRQEHPDSVDHPAAAASLGAVADGLSGLPSTLPSVADGSLAAIGDDLPALLAALQAAADTSVTELLAAADIAMLADDDAARALTAARARAGHRARGERASADLDLLAQSHQAHLERLSTIDAAARAAAIEGHLTARRRALAEVEAAEVAHSSAVADAFGLGSSFDGHNAPEDNATKVNATRDNAAGVGAGVDVETPHRDVVDVQVRIEGQVVADSFARVRAHDEGARDLEAAQRRLALVSTRLRAIGDDVALAQDRLTQAQVAHAAAEVECTERAEEVIAAESVSHDVMAAQAEVDLVTNLRSAVAAIVRDRTELAVREDDRRAAHERANTARTLHLDLRERHLGTMAAELAEDLLDDQPCMVCGSPVHPDPARAVDRVNREEVEAAESAAGAADNVHLDASLAVERVRSRLEARTLDLGNVDETGLETRLREAQSALHAAQAQVRLIASLRARLQGADERLEQARQQLEGALATCQGVALVQVEVGHEVESLTAQVTDLADGHAECPCARGEADWTIRVHDRLREALEEAMAASARLTTAQQVLALAEEDVTQALQDNGFETVAAAEAARRSAPDLATIRGAVADHERALAAARSTLEEPEVTAALTGPPDDVDALATAAESTRQELLRATRQHSSTEARRLELSRLIPALLVDLDVWTATRRTADRVRSLADLVSGLGPDNALRMRLTSYVLAARLESVVTFANERLSTLGAGRYLLEHTDEKVGGARSGLGLRVMDQWTGQFRDPASLSGGETFMASLSLALGLADAVRADSGGYDLGTLFVDEGFGSLDDESLEEVMGILDGLQSGGRSVGIVSHVADLRTRIPRQLVVHKTPDGSTISTALGAAADLAGSATAS